MKQDMDINAILKHLPHRYPFLLIDRIIKFEPGKSLVAIKNLTINEAFFVGHFPQRPVMPGVLIIESLAQAASVLAYKTAGYLPGDSEPLFLLAGINKARFRRVVEPGDQLQLEVKFSRSKRSVWVIEGSAFVGSELACSAELLSVQR
jgi:3-hydroxyacyl-[acyl-carrier-protein] dehydratase